MMTVLGISIGTRHNGVAVITDRKLKASHVHTFNERWSRKKVKLIVGVVDRYLTDHVVTMVVVKVPKPSHFSLALKQLLRAMEKVICFKGCLVRYVSVEDIKRHDPDITNKKTLCEKVVVYYPSLIHELRKESKNKQPYYIKVFEATIVAHHEVIGRKY